MNKVTLTMGGSLWAGLLVILMAARSVPALAAAESAAPPQRILKFQADTPAEARQWQQQSRDRLLALMMGGARPEILPLEAQVLGRPAAESPGYRLEELSLRSLPDRRVHAWLAIPTQSKGRGPAVLALHGHGGNGQEVVRGTSLYWYGRRLAEAGFVVISPDIGSHELQHTNWTLMGERTWDALRCVDYLVTRPDVDAGRLSVCGLSLGGETTMYVAALDERLNSVCSSGWLTTIANMKTGHCPCWNFPGLEQHFDFADLFGCIAPRPLVCEVGEQERAPGGFPVNVARSAFAELQRVWRVFDAEGNVTLAIHPGGHVFVGREYFQRIGVGNP